MNEPLMTDYENFGYLVKILYKVLHPLPQEPVRSLQKMSDELRHWSVASRVASWYCHLLFIIYSAILLGLIGVPFWMWFIWAAFVVGHVSQWACVSQADRARINYYNAVNADAASGNPTTEKPMTEAPKDNVESNIK